MTNELLKSVRAVKACDLHHAGITHGPGPGDSTAVDHPWCDDCLRLVLAHCGELAARLINENTWKPETIARAIRREFGVK